MDAAQWGRVHPATLALLLLVLNFVALLACPTPLAAAATDAAGTAHTSNWAVLVSTSRYWLNYRHSANIMSVYRAIRQLGIPDARILLMLADDHACNPRNPFKATLHSNESHLANVYGEAVEVDYRGYEVSVESLVRLLTGTCAAGWLWLAGGG